MKKKRLRTADAFKKFMQFKKTFTGCGFDEKIRTGFSSKLATLIK